MIGFLAGLGLAAKAALGFLPGSGIASFPAEMAVPAAVHRESPASLLDLSDAELLGLVETDPASLGSLSIGRPGSAAMFNAVPLPADSRWAAAPSAVTWATAETVEAVAAVVGKVHELFPGTQPIFIGDISGRDGGRLKRHLSHQGGRDVDFGFYYKGGLSAWYRPGTAANLDLPRNWVLVRAMITQTDVETILLDTRIQRALYGYALSIGEEKAWLDRVFQFSRGYSKAIICHAAGHRTHYHVRFFNPVAQELGRRVYPMLLQLKKIKPPVFSVNHRVREGETLGHLARRYGASVRAIQQYNGLASTQIRAGRVYRIPLKGVSAPPVKPLILPARFLPPVTPELLASAAWPTPASLYGERMAELSRSASVIGFAFRRI
ncbi:MAG: penicillin-insensitive murein endopeptidase [Candidatus Aminicenantes bacterium]|nr:penicillin-insensitive murein endopeptidase [Candidatus Aminicenantes bacterium]